MKMEEITREAVYKKHCLKPRRRCFADHSGIQQHNKSFSVKFSDTIGILFLAETGLPLFQSSQYNNYFRMNTDEELHQIQQWEEKQGDRVFLRDCLSASIALGTNLIDNMSAEYTQIGLLEHRGKKCQDQEAIVQLSEITAKTINDLPFYKDADLICSVPPGPGKEFDLPSRVTSLVSSIVGKNDVTDGFVYEGVKSSVKTSTFDEKWDVWEKAQVSFKKSAELNVNDQSVILIDDKYQSGITIQYIAMKLQQAGANKVYGLSFVKTLSDTDNV